MLPGESYGRRGELTLARRDKQPCIGIARSKRWRRAQNLGLKPPIEVLAVLMQERERQNLKAERAHVDELLSSRSVVET